MNAKESDGVAISAKDAKCKKPKTRTQRLETHTPSSPQSSLYVLYTSDTDERGGRDRVVAGSRFVAVSDQRGASRLLVLAQHRRVVGLERRELLALALAAPRRAQRQHGQRERGEA